MIALKKYFYGKRDTSIKDDHTMVDYSLYDDITFVL